MSAPDTNIGKQEKQHRPSLIGLKGAILFAALVLLGVVGFNMINRADEISVMGTAPVVGVAADENPSGANSSATPAATN